MLTGPLNYNPVEEWFFHRIKAGRPIPVPNSGLQVCCLPSCWQLQSPQAEAVCWVQVTQLGHVKDLSDAFVKVLGNPKAKNQVCSCCLLRDNSS